MCFNISLNEYFVMTEEELWIQQNLDRHQPSNMSSYTEIIKVDREIRELYGLSDEVQPADRDDYRLTDIEKRLSQSIIHDKRRWIIRWKDTIRSSIKRNKREAAEANPIWSHYI